MSIGIGAFPIVTLAEARTAALENRRAVARGHDPRHSIPTLAQASERVLAVYSANWKDSGRSEKIWRAGMVHYVLPQLGRKRVDHITTVDVMSVLLPHWSTKRETMRRIKQRLSRIFRQAIAEGYRTDDPAGAALDAALPRNGGKTQHFAAVPHGEVAAAIATVRASGAYRTTVLAFEFLVLCAARSGEVRAGDVGRSGPRCLDRSGESGQNGPGASGSPQFAGFADSLRGKGDIGRQGVDLSESDRQGAIGRDALQAAQRQGCGGSARLPIFVPGLVRRERPAARGCRGVSGARCLKQG